MQVNGNAAPHLPHYPRPETAMQRLAAVERRRKHDRLSEQLYPKG